MKEQDIQQGSNLYADACTIIEQAQQAAYHAINITLIKRNWLLGMRIQKEVLKEQRAGYGEQMVQNLSNELTRRYGKGFAKTNLYQYVSFYNYFPDIFHTLSGKCSNNVLPVADAESVDAGIFHTLCGKSEMAQTPSGHLPVNIYDSIGQAAPIRLSWSHYRTILQEKNQDARIWYEQEAANETWSVRTLQRNISSQYYHRILMSQHKELVHNEMIEKTTPLQDKMEFIKNPIIAEFLGFPQESAFTESELEASIISNLQKFIMELGKGYAFVARQQHIHTEKEDYFIDLVFYNYLLKSFVLIDLKTTKVTHQDVGQMDMYVRMYDELKRGEGDNPTVGILICADTDEDIARYSVLHNNDQLFAAKYKTFMPTDEELRAEIESQKNIYYLQHHKE